MVSSPVHIPPATRDMFQMVPSVDMLTYKQVLTPARYSVM